MATIISRTEKVSVDDNDYFHLADSTAGNADKKIKHSTIKDNIYTSIVDLSEKTSIVDNDYFRIVDSEDSNINKKIKHSTVKEDILSITPTYITGVYTVQSGDTHIFATGTFTVTLPAISSSAGRVITIKNISTGVITVDGNGAETIDGALTYTLNQYDSITLGGGTSEWHLI